MIPHVATTTPPSPKPVGSVVVSSLAEEHAAEVIAFLAERPIHTVIMASFVRDNGIMSPLNRGTFYGCRNESGALEGVALIGHATLFETRTERAVEAFAQLAQGCERAHVLLAEQDKAELFWQYYSDKSHSARRICREALFEQRWPVMVREEVEGLRPATLEDLDLVAPVQAQMAFDEGGVNPMEKDREGFLRRCARRIELGRTWVWVEDGRLIFKADIISETPEVIYLEGVWVNPQERGKNYGLRCMAQLSRQLLRRAGSISILANEQNPAALSLYRKAGFKQKGMYDTIYLQQQGEQKTA